LTNVTKKKKVLRDFSIFKEDYFMLRRVFYVVLICLLSSPVSLLAQNVVGDDNDRDTTAATESEKDVAKKETEKKENHKKKSVNEIVVKGQANKMVFPIVTKEKDLPGDPQSILDIMKSQAILNYRGQSDLVTKDDDYFMRGFGSNRFTTAVDGMVIRKTGGRQASDIVDYGFIPPWLVETTELIPGPHSALFPAKSIGGVVNFVTKKPTVRDTFWPEIDMSISYKSYNTQNYNTNVSGSVYNFTYDAGYQYYYTDGYLRHTNTAVQNIFGRLGYAFENGGYVALSIMDSRADRELAVENYPGVDADDGCPIATATYDNDYPIVDVEQTGNTRNKFYSWQDPTWDRTSRAYRLGASYPTFLGTFSLGAYLHKEVKTKEYEQYKSGAISHNESETKYWSQGGRIEDVISITECHKTTVAYDMEQLFDGDDRDKRVEVHGGALQHEWIIIDPLTLTLGMRYEHVWINVSNASTNPIAGQGDWIEKNWQGFMPKSALEYDMDNLAEFLRDTSLILAASRIWHAPDSHGLYDPQGKPTGYWLKPETGMGYDLIFSRRLFGDFYMKAGYSFSHIEKYFAYNSTHAEYTPTAYTGDASLYYKDYMLNLDQMHRHGVEVDMNGNVLDCLKVNLSYAFQKYFNRGDEPAGKETASDRPEHKLNAGIRYTIIRNLVVMADYSFQSKQVATTVEEVDDGFGGIIYDVQKNPMEAYQLVNLGMAFAFIDHQLGMKNATIKIYVNNVFGEKYENAKGYQMTGRTYGCALSAKI
jgi:iron complex outermembrane receptor protein